LYHPAVGPDLPVLFRRERRVHEWALAEGVIVTALEEAEKEGLREITRIDVSIGELQRISEETFRFAISEVLPARNPRLRSTEIRLQVEPAAFRCRACGREFPLAEAGGGLDANEGEAVHFVPELAHAWLRCPACKGPDFEVVRGRGVFITGVEGS